ncbi:MAG: hypothetical protein SPG40_09250 [Kiritimatiellia bacterium]|nr:hypothetical protein [Kiritimatiellia bacterium]
MKFKIIRSKFLEGLASVQNIIAEEHQSGIISVIVEALGENHISSSAAFRAGLVEEYNTEHGCNCPICGGRLEYVTGPDWIDVLVCEQCKHEISDDLSESKIYRVSECGMAEFVRKQLGLDYAQRMGNGNYRLGKLHSKKVFFCVSPNAGFYNAHNKDSIFILCDISSVPRDWTENGCHAILFTELFYEKKSSGDFGIAKDVLNDLKPKEPNRRFGKNRLIHERRDLWLSVLMHILTAKYNGNDFKKGMLTGAAAARWFNKVHPRSKLPAWTLARDIKQLVSGCTKNTPYDKHEDHITTFLKLAADPNLTQDKRAKAADYIKELLLKATEDTKRNGGKMVELPEVGWVTGADGRSEAVPATSEDTVINAVDSNLRKGQRGERAA